MVKLLTPLPLNFYVIQWFFYHIGKFSPSLPWFCIIYLKCSIILLLWTQMNNHDRECSALLWSKLHCLPSISPRPFYLMLLMSTTIWSKLCHFAFCLLFYIFLFKNQHNFPILENISKLSWKFINKTTLMVSLTLLFSLSSTNCFKALSPYLSICKGFFILIPQTNTLFVTILPHISPWKPQNGFYLHSLRVFFSDRCGVIL